MTLPELIQVGHDALLTDDLPRARRAAEQAQQLAPDHPASLALLAEVTRLAGDPVGAMRHYERALAQPMEPPTAWFAHANYAELLLAQGEARAALPHLRAAIEHQPSQLDPYRTLAQTYVQLGQPQNALHWLNELLALDEGETEARLARAALLAPHNPAEAMSDYAWLIDHAPEQPTPYLAYAQLAARMGDRTAAQRTLTEGLDILPLAEQEPLRVARARLLAQLGEWEGALADLDELLAASPEADPVLYLARGEVRLDAEDPEGALADFERVLAHEPRHAEALRGRLDSLMLLERTAAVGETLAALVELAPSAELHTRQGDWFWEAGRLDEARAAYVAAMALEPRHPLASFHLALLLMEEAQWEEALAPLDQAIEAMPQDEERYHARSVALRHLGFPFLAWMEADRALQIDDLFIEALLARALAAIARGDAVAALADLDEALHLYPSYGDAMATQARLLASLGRADEAKALWEAHAALPPEERGQGEEMA